MFRLPSDTSVDYIKRVIGVPGDRIQVRQGVLHINGQPVERRLVGNGRQGASGGGQTTTLYQETLPGGLTHLIQEISDRQTFETHLNMWCRPGIIL